MAGLNTSSAVAAFEKMEDKVLAMESAAEAATLVRGAGGTLPGLLLPCSADCDAEVSPLTVAVLVALLMP